MYRGLVFISHNCKVATLQFDRHEVLVMISE